MEDCENGDIRLRNRSRQDAGYGVVELCLNNQWGTLCRDGFSSLNEAPLVCEQLGFSPEGTYNINLCKCNNTLCNDAFSKS